MFVRHKIFGCTWHCLNKNQVSAIFLCITSFVFCTHLLYECTAADMGGNHACIHETWSSWSINGCLHAADLLYATGSANNSTTAHLVFVKGQWLEEKENKVCCCMQKYVLLSEIHCWSWQNFVHNRVMLISKVVRIFLYDCDFCLPGLKGDLF